MNTNNIQSMIESTDWEAYMGPNDYNVSKVINSLVCLLKLTDSDQAENVGDIVINSLGSNHRGVYFPALIEAADIIKAIIDASDNSNVVRKICSMAILNDFYYFEPEMGSYSGYSFDEVKSIISSKLSIFSDELVSFPVSNQGREGDFF